jgi:hypothetical protein
MAENEVTSGPRFFDGQRTVAMQQDLSASPQPVVPAAPDGDGTLFIAIPSYRGTNSLFCI